MKKPGLEGQCALWNGKMMAMLKETQRDRGWKAFRGRSKCPQTAMKGKKQTQSRNHNKLTGNVTGKLKLSQKITTANAYAG